MDKVHAPYHFVPLSKWVYMPDWANLVSHDHPFEDGYSGVIEYTLTNKTKLCVGDKHIKQEDGSTLVKFARAPDGHPVIPGSSIKGMIRNVLEIASFSKFANIDDAHLSHRDVSKGEKYLHNIAPNPIIEAAWLQFDQKSSEWKLSLCDWARVDHKVLNESLFNDNNKINNNMSAIERYQYIDLNQEFKVVTEKITPFRTQINQVKEISKDQGSANIVFTNQRVVGNTGQENHYNFSYCFYGNLRKVDIEQNELSTIVMEFKKSHSAKQNSAQLEYLTLNQHTLKGIPVFAVFDGSNKKRNLTALGLAKMPRVKYKYSVEKLADIQQGRYRVNENFFDIPELMFGTIRESGMSIKSRVFFPDAKQNSSDNLKKESENVILASPKPSFLATYLEQPDENYTTYDNKESKLAGWKRYISASKFVTNTEGKQENDENNKKIETTLECAPPNTSFTGKIMVHNITEIELGALLWSIKLGRATESEPLFHSLGHGKPLGAGAIQLQINTLKVRNNSDDKNSELSSFDEETFIAKFIDHMNKEYPSEQNNWENSPQIKYLQAIANQKENANRTLRYNTLGDQNNTKKKEFEAIKKSESSLSGLSDNGYTISRNEPEDISDYLPKSFQKGRLSSLVLEDIDKEWLEKMEIEKQKELEMLAKKQNQANLTAKNEQALNIDDPYKRVLTQLQLLVEQSKLKLSKQIKKDANKNMRAIIKTLKTLPLSSEQVNDLKMQVIEIAPFGEKESLTKWLNNYTNE